MKRRVLGFLLCPLMVLLITVEVPLKAHPEDLFDSSDLTLEELYQLRGEPDEYRELTWYDEKQDEVLAALADIPGLIWILARAIELKDSLQGDDNEYVEFPCTSS